MAESLFKRERYLRKVRPFVHDTELIKDITGIRRCGKSSLMSTIAEELVAGGTPADHIITLDLDSRALRTVRSPGELDAIIAEKLPHTAGTTYLFIDEIQNVAGFEDVINAYRNDGNISIFMTGSNSYLLSGELATKLTGRYVEIELFTLNFSEYLGMREHLGKPTQPLAQSFQEWLRYGGFPKAVEYDDVTAKSRYIEDIVSQILEKDIRSRVRIGDRNSFDKVLTYVTNNFAAPTNLTKIAAHLRQAENTPIKTSTLASYIDVLVNAKILYRCDRFDLKSKRSLQGGEKYYLADTGLYFARNVDATISYGPLLENVTYTYLRSQDYRVSVGTIGPLELDFIVRRPQEGYAYIQVSMTVADPNVEAREYRPFMNVRDSWPKYLLTLDPLPSGKDGITHLNLMEMMAADREL